MYSVITSAGSAVALAFCEQMNISAAKYMTIHILSLDFIFNQSHTHTSLVFRTIWTRINSCRINAFNPSKAHEVVSAQFHTQEDWGAQMKHWPTVTQQVRRVARTDLKQAVFRGHALHHHAVPPLTALDGAPAHSMYNSLLFRAFTVVLWSSIVANAHL